MYVMYENVNSQILKGLFVDNASVKLSSIFLGLFLFASAYSSSQTSADEKFARSQFGPPVSFSEIFAQSSKSIATIVVTKAGGAKVSGTAWLITPTKVITCLHVVEGAESINLVFSGDSILGSVNLSATVLGTAPVADLAILQIERKVSRPPLQLDTSWMGLRTVEGCPVSVIGSPKGLELTLSTGIVSAHRWQERPGASFPKMDFIQISAPVSHGSSGSPLFSDRGMVIGIVQSKVSDGENLNFAVRSDEIIIAFEQMIRPEINLISLENERKRVLLHFMPGKHVSLDLTARSIGYQSSLEIRSEPSDKSRQIGVFREGEVFAVASIVSKSKGSYKWDGVEHISNNEWVKVYMPKGKFGYVQLTGSEDYPVLTAKIRIDN